MNIAFIFYAPIIPHLGGVQRVTDNLAREFQKMGHNVMFISTSEYNEDFKDYSAEQVFLTGYKDSKEAYLKQYLDVLNHYKIDVCVCQALLDESLLLLKNTPKHIKVVSAYHTIPYPFVGKERRIKRNIHSKSLKVNFLKYLVLAFPWIGRYRYITKETHFFREFLDVSDKLVFLSERFCKDTMKYLQDSDANKLTAINNPNTFSVTDKIEKKKENLILVVARLVEVPKNIREFIDVWSILCKKNPDWKALIIGDGCDRKYLENYAREKNVTNLEFTGYVSNVSDFYAQARIVCTTSILEGWGMTLTEGMSYGCIPCAYGSYGSVYDIIDDGINGMITTPFSPENMAERIQEVIDNKDLAEKLSKGAIKKVQDFSADKIAQKWIDLFNELINAD